MSTQSEAILEENLIKQLVDLKYERVSIKDDNELEIEIEKNNSIKELEEDIKKYDIKVSKEKGYQ